MVDEGCLAFAAALQAAGEQPRGWAAPQLVTRDLLSECKGPDAEWLVQSGGSSDGAPGGAGGGGRQSVAVDARSLPAVAEEQWDLDAGAGSSDEATAAAAAVAAAAVAAAVAAAERDCASAEPLLAGELPGGAPAAAEHAAPGAGEPEQQPGMRGADSFGGLSSVLSSPEPVELQEAPAGPAAGPGAQQEQRDGDGTPPAAAARGGFLTPFKNPVFVADAEEAEAGSPAAATTPAGSAAQALITPAAALGGTEAERPARVPDLGLARSLEAELLGAGGGLGLEAAAAAELQARLGALEGEVAQLRWAGGRAGGR